MSCYCWKGVTVDQRRRRNGNWNGPYRTSLATELKEYAEIKSVRLYSSVIS